ncbi:MAG: exodeoxyribonuclease VII small subunit [Gammaproteobacteria bacterium]
MARKTPINFEQSLAELEQLVDAMEQGDLPLEEALKQFEKGISLASSCQKALQDAEQKVKQLVEKNGELLEKSFDLDE